MNRRPCCCTPSACTITIWTRDPCTAGTPSVGQVDLVLRDPSTGAIVATGQTDVSTGLWSTTSLPAGTYRVVASKSGRRTHDLFLALACGGVYTVLMPSTTATWRITPSGCNNAFGGGQAGLPGLPVTISKGSWSLSGTTGADGSFWFYPGDGTGVYTYTVFGGPQFQDRTAGFNITTICTSGAINPTLTLASGYSCCNNWKSGRGIPPYAIKTPLTITTSGGQTALIECLGGVACIDSDVCPTLVNLNPVVCPSTCVYQTAPTLASGRRKVRVVLGADSGGDIWRPRLYYWRGTTTWATAQTCANCGSLVPSDRREYYLTDDAPCEGSLPGGIFSSSSRTTTINSLHPLSITYTYDDPANEAWSWSGGPLLSSPPPIASITIAEL